MYIRQLQCFVLAAQEKSFVRAAEKLFVTQPAVTQQMNALEEELNVELFNRTNKKIELTPAGRHFYTQAVKIVEMTAAAVRETKQIDDEIKNTVNIRYFASFEENTLPILIKKFSELYPAVNLIVSQIAAPADLDSPGVNVKNSLLFVTEDYSQYVKDMIFTPLFTAGLCCVLAANHPLAAKKIITLKDLKGYRLIFARKELAAPHHWQLKTEMENYSSSISFLESMDPESCLSLVSSYLGIVFTLDTNLPSRPNVRTIPLQSDFAINVGFLTAPNASKAVKEFIAVSQNILFDKEGRWPISTTFPS